MFAAMRTFHGWHKKGCCNLRCEHITLCDDNYVEFDFLGKDSIRYHNRVLVEQQVWKNIRIFMKDPKTPADPLFDRLTTSTLNAYLNTLMEGLSAKVCACVRAN